MNNVKMNKTIGKTVEKRHWLTKNISNESKKIKSKKIIRKTKSIHKKNEKWKKKWQKI